MKTFSRQSFRVRVGLRPQFLCRPFLNAQHCHPWWINSRLKSDSHSKNTKKSKIKLVLSKASHFIESVTPHSHTSSHPLIAHELDSNSEIETKAQQCENVTRWGVYVNVGLVLLKGGIGILTHSVSLTADAIHSLTDLVSDFITLITLRYARRKPTQIYPFGFGKIDCFGTLLSASILAMGSLHIISNALHMLSAVSHHSSMVVMPTAALACVIASLIAKEWLFRITLNAGTQYGSQVTIANAWHHRSDVWSSIAALVGVGGVICGFPLTDPICGLLVGSILGKISFDFAKSSIFGLMDSNIRTQCPALVKQIEDTAMQATSVDTRVNHVECSNLRRSGPFYHCILQVCVDSNLQIKDIEPMCNGIRTHIRTQFTALQYVIVIPQTPMKHKCK